MATKPLKVADGDAALSTSTPKTSGNLTVLTYDLLIALGGGESANGTLALATMAAGPTFANKALQNNGDGSYSYTRIDGAVATAGLTAAISQARTGSDNFALNGAQFRNSRGFGAASSANNAIDQAPTAPSWELVTTENNSAIIICVCDWNAVDGASRTWRTINSITPTSGNGLELLYSRVAGACTFYVAYWDDVGAAGSKTVGISAPSGQRWTGCALEIKGSGAKPVFQRPWRRWARRSQF